MEFTIPFVIGKEFDKDMLFHPYLTEALEPINIPCLHSLELFEFERQVLCQVVYGRHV